MLVTGKKSQNKLVHISITSQEELNKILGGNLFVHSVGPSRNSTSLISRTTERLGVRLQTSTKDDEEK